jgi:hypothetical protein
LLVAPISVISSDAISAAFFFFKGRQPFSSHLRIYTVQLNLAKL